MNTTKIEVWGNPPSRVTVNDVLIEDIESVDVRGRAEELVTVEIIFSMPEVHFHKEAYKP